MNGIGQSFFNFGKSSNVFFSAETQKSRTQTVFNANNEAKEIRRAISKYDKNDSSLLLQTPKANDIVSSAFSYSESLRAQRQNAKDTSLSVKKIKYQFKDISSKIIRSKTSASARRVVSQAKREILRLKREKANSSSDIDELDAAIAHAKAMERIAKKKVKHLEEEEMAKACGGPCADRFVDGETKENSSKVREEDELSAEEQAEDSLLNGIETDDYDETDFLEELDFEGIDFKAEFMDEMADLTSELMDSISDQMQELLEDMGLDELSDSLSAAKKDMDPADLKAMKIRHRNKEMKEIVKADAEYLKTVFEHYQNIKSDAASSLGGLESGGSAPLDSTSTGSIDIAL